MLTVNLKSKRKSPPKGGRCLKNLDIREVSLVSSPANGTPFALWKNAAGVVDEATRRHVRFIKADSYDDEKRVVYGVVYEPLVKDSQDDYSTEEEIEKGAHGYLGNTQAVVGLEHSEPADAVVVESYIAPQNIKIGKQAIAKGTWVMAVRVDDDSTWEAVKSGDITGFSMAGLADSADEDEEPKAASVIKGDISKGNVSDIYGLLMECRAAAEAIATMLGGTVPDYSGPAPQSITDVEKGKAALNAMADWLTDVASACTSLMHTKAALAKSNGGEQKEKAMTPEEKAAFDALKKQNEEQAARLSAIEATNKIAGEEKQKAEDEADRKQLEAMDAELAEAAKKAQADLAAKVEAGVKAHLDAEHKKVEQAEKDRVSNHEAIHGVNIDPTVNPDGASDLANLDGDDPDDRVLIPAGGRDPARVKAEVAASDANEDGD